jgi:hypothetical protein
VILRRTPKSPMSTVPVAPRPGFLSKVVKTFHYRLNLQGLRASPVEGGHESYGVPLYARVNLKYDDVVHTAKNPKIGIHPPAAHLAFGDREALIDVGIRSMMWEVSDSNALTVGLRSVCMN